MPAAIDRGSTRDASLDLARAVAVVAMVVGHTLDALLDTALRDTPGVATYWKFRGLTAPMFLVVSGWAVSLVLSRGDLRGAAIVRKRLPRVLILLAVGYALRLPTWGFDRLLAGDAEVFRHALAFDALHVVASGLLAGAVVFAVLPDRPTRLATMLLLAIAVPLVSGPAWALLTGAPLLVRQSVGGGDAPFAMLPWVAYFFAGAVLGLVPRFAPRVMLLILAGFAFSGAAWIAGLSNLAVTSPVLFLWRLGQIALLLAAVSLVPAALALRAAPLGRSSLGIYVFHVPLLYGWGEFAGLAGAVGPTCNLLPALGVGGALLVGGFVVSATGAWLVDSLALLPVPAFLTRARPAASADPA